MGRLGLTIFGLGEQEKKPTGFKSGKSEVLIFWKRER
jgi:hypothetical protein